MSKKHIKEHLEVLSAEFTSYFKDLPLFSLWPKIPINVAIDPNDEEAEHSAGLKASNSSKVSLKSRKKFI